MIDQEEVLTFTGTTGRSKTNNNPFNLEYRPGTYQDKYNPELEPQPRGGSRRRFAKFKTMMDGYLAGLDQIRLDQKKGHTLSSFVHKFAPSFENPTEELIKQYGRVVGASGDTPLSAIPAEKLAIPMLARESSTRIVGKGAVPGGTATTPTPKEEAVPPGLFESVFGRSGTGRSPLEGPPPDVEDTFNPLKPQEPSKPFTPEVPKWGSVDQPNVRPTSKDVRGANDDEAPTGFEPGTAKSIFGGLSAIGESPQQPPGKLPLLGEALSALGPKEAEANPGIRFGSRYIEILKGAVKKFPTTATGEEILTTLERQSLLPKGFKDAYLKDPKVTRDSLVPHLEKNWIHPKLNVTDNVTLDPIQLAKEQLAELTNKYTGSFSEGLQELRETSLKKLNENFKHVKLNDGEIIESFELSKYGGALRAKLGNTYYPVDELIFDGLLVPNKQLTTDIQQIYLSLSNLIKRTGGYSMENKMANLAKAIREQNQALAMAFVDPPRGVEYGFKQMLHNPSSSAVELRVSPSGKWMAGKQRPKTHFDESEFAHVRGTVDGDRFVIQELQSDWVKGHEQFAKIIEVTDPKTNSKFFTFKNFEGVPRSEIPASNVFNTREEANTVRELLIKNRDNAPPPEAVKNWHRQAIDSTLAWAAENPNINKVTLFGEETISHLRGAPKGNYPIYNTANKYFHTRAGELGAKTSVEPVSSVFSDFVPKHQAVTLHLDDKVRAAIKKGVLLGGAGAAVALGAKESAADDTVPPGLFEKVFGKGPGAEGDAMPAGVMPQFGQMPIPGESDPSPDRDEALIGPQGPGIVAPGMIPLPMQTMDATPEAAPGQQRVPQLGMTPGMVPDQGMVMPTGVEQGLPQGQPQGMPPGMDPYLTTDPSPDRDDAPVSSVVPPGTVSNIFGTSSPQLVPVSPGGINYPQDEETSWLQLVADLGLVGLSLLPAGRLMKIPALAKQGALVKGLITGTTSGLGYGAGKELSEALGMNLFGKHHSFIAESGPGKILEDMALFTAGDLLIPPAIQKISQWVKKLGHTKVAEKAWDIISVPVNKTKELLQPPMERLRLTHKSESSSIRNARVMEELVKDSGVDVTREVTKMPFMERHEFLGGLDRGSVTTPSVKQLITDLNAALPKESAGPFRQVYVAEVNKFADNILSKVDGVDVQLLEPILKQLDAARGAKKPLKAMEAAIKGLLDNNLISPEIRAYALDLYNLHATLPRQIAAAANKAAEEQILHKLIRTPGTVSSKQKPGYVPATHPKLVGSFVHKDIELELKYAREIDEMARNWYQKWFLNPWKTSKVPLRPASHFRDMFGAMILNDIGGLSFTNVPMYIRAFMEMKNQGPMYKEFVKTVGRGTTFTKEELKEVGGALEYGSTLPQKLLHLFDKVVAPARNLYNAEETWFKLAKFMHNREKGMSRVDSGIDALKYGLNYKEVTPLIAKIRSHPLGAPFITFQSKVLPLLAESMIRHPLRTTKWAALPIALTGYSLDKIGMSRDEWDRFKEILPGYLKGSWYAPLPYRDEKDNLKLMNLAWLIPGFGEINEIIQRGENNPYAIFLQSPMFTIGGTLLTKQKPSGAPLYYEWEAPAAKAMKSIAFIWQSLLPAHMPGGTDFQAIYDAYHDRPEALTMNEAILANLGFRVTSVNPTMAMKRHETLKRIHAAEAASQMKRDFRRSISDEQTQEIIEQYQMDRQKILSR